MASTLTLSRRALLGAIATIGATPSKLMAQPARTIFAGTYQSEGGQGVVQLDAASDGWAMARSLPAITNASFGTASDRSGLRYLVNEQNAGALGVYTGDLRRIATFSTLGADPCHAALSPDGRALAVANYSSGSVAYWRLDPRSGLPAAEAQAIMHEGSGPNRERQTGPHAHWVGFAPGGSLLHAVDLGADAIFSHRFDTRSGRRVGTTIAYRAQPGSGPRHLARHPRLPLAFLVAELANTVTILRAHADGSFSTRGVVSTLPTGFKGASAAAHIAVNRAGDRLYVSNRGHDSIAVFAIAKGGELTLLQHADCGGHWPRMFLLLEERGEMLVANQRSGGVATLRVGKNGALRAASPGVSVPGVAFLSR